MKRLLLPGLLVIAVLLAGCGSSSSGSLAQSSTSSGGSSSSSGGAAPSGGASVTMKNLAFSPTTVTVKVGQTVQFTNQDTAPHNVTYVSGPKFTSSSNLNNGDSFSLKATQAGTIHYFCTIHPFMKATIVVTQ